MNRNAFVLTLFAALAVVSAASAATVRFELAYNSLVGDWRLFASELDGPADNGGIASYGVVLTGVAAIDHASPRDGFAQGPSGIGPAGFTTLRSPDGAPVLLASQDTVTPTPNLIYGFGQQGSSFAAMGITDFTAGIQLEAPNWGSPLLIAQGTYVLGTGSHPAIDRTSADTFSNVFADNSGTRTRAATLQVQVFDAFDTDFDNDDDTDGTDFLIWQRNFGINDGTAVNSMADADFNGRVNGVDLTLWKNNFGAPSTVVVVPETAGRSSAIVALIVVAPFAYRRINWGETLAGRWRDGFRVSERLA